MGNCVGSKGVKKDPKVLTEEEIKLLLDNTTLTRAQIVALHQNFLKECPSGKLTKKDFVKLFKEVHPSENKKEKADKFCEYVFKVIDKNNLGYISFQDFVLCFSLTSYGDFREKCEFAFKLYDLDKDGKISKKEMTQVLTALYDLSGITDRKGANAPAKKVEEIIKKIHATYQPPPQAGEQSVATTSATASAPSATKDKEKEKEKKNKEKADKEKEKADKKNKEKADKEAKKETAKKEKTKEKKEKPPKPAKPAKEPKAPKAPKAPKVKIPEFISKEQFIDACNSDETLKKLFVDSIFSNQNTDLAHEIDNKVTDIANKISIELPSASFSGPQISTSTKNIHLESPKINGPIIESNLSSSSSPYITTTTTKVVTINNNEPPVITTTTTRSHSDQDERQHGAATINSDSDQTNYSEHVTEYVSEPKHYTIELSTDGVKLNESDKQEQHHQQ
jgi:Ca2+-binding EF-hand superfamily protein